jgi:tRNA(Ile)-lysidine synthase
MATDNALPEAIDRFHPRLPLAIAYSGGADSTALLLACAERWPGSVCAVHVNHGLQAAALDFERHCVEVCANHQIPLKVMRVNAQALPGQSPEDAARIARYAALASALVSPDSLSNSAIAPVNAQYFAIKNVVFDFAHVKDIALAQHADDQVETIVLALGRGGGLAGLAGMPAHWERGGLQFHRPLLGVSATDIRHWLTQRQLPFIEDPTNTDERFTRNRIRAQLLPALQSVFPAFRDTFARSSAHAAQAQALLIEVAEQDFSSVSVAPAQLHLAKLQALSQARQGNLLRHWLKVEHHTVPSAAQLAELLSQIEASTTRGHQILIKVGRGFAKRQGDVLSWYNP